MESFTSITQGTQKPREELHQRRDMKPQQKKSTALGQMLRKTNEKHVMSYEQRAE